VQVEKEGVPMDVGSLAYSSHDDALLITGSDSSITTVNSQLEPLELKGAFAKKGAILSESNGIFMSDNLEFMTTNASLLAVESASQEESVGKVLDKASVLKMRIDTDKVTLEDINSYE